jgi:hypothetical protein
MACSPLREDMACRIVCPVFTAPQPGSVGQRSCPCQGGPLPAPVGQAFLPARVYRQTHRRGPTASTHGRQDCLPHCGRTWRAAHCGRTWPAGLPAPRSSLRNPGPVGQAFLPLPGKSPCRPQWRRHSCLPGCARRLISRDPLPEGIADAADKIVCPTAGARGVQPTAGARGVQPTAGGHGVLDRLPRVHHSAIRVPWGRHSCPCQGSTPAGPSGAGIPACRGVPAG